MSTGKKIAKRSIIGTRICAPGDDGLFYSGVIQNVKISQDFGNELFNETRYTVKFDTDDGKKIECSKRDYIASELIGPGFQPLSKFRLLPRQKVYITYNGREISGHIVQHDTENDEVTLAISPPSCEVSITKPLGKIEIRKRLEELRLLESRKSPRLMDLDTDFARLADMAADRKRPSSMCIEVPSSAVGSRKRRTSRSHEDQKEDQMNECTAALVLMSLSCSPSSSFTGSPWFEHQQPLSPSASFSDGCSWRSGTPSPPLSESGKSGVWGSVGTDEGIVLDEDYDEYPAKKKVNRLLFQCTWPGCTVITTTCECIEAHVRNVHLGSRIDKSSPDNGFDDESSYDDHEEEFYYTEVELEETYSPPTMSHRDMARPPHEDPEYQKSLLPPPLPPTLLFTPRKSITGPINIPKRTLANNIHYAPAPTTYPAMKTPNKQIKLSSLAPTTKSPVSPTRKTRGDTKKCRKVYGMENRDLWCTQCKWKKACSRFSD